MKTCTMCNKKKPLTDFYVRRDRPCGYASECKKCIGKRVKNYSESNKGLIKLRSSAYYKNNKELIIKANAVYKKTETGKRVERKYNQSEKGKVRRKKAIKKYYNSDKGKQAWATAKKNRAPILKEYMRDWRKTENGRAIIKAHEANRKNAGSVTVEMIKSIEQSNVKKYGTLTCEYCKIPVGDTYHLEHKTPISRGGKTVKINLCIACPPCNLSKHILTADEYRKRLRVI